ncbi:uncharacterized protein LOC144110086 isoform X1 [Amblyomma americanum]
MEQQRSMMLSRAMSQRSVVIRPATQETGGMIQYLLTIVFLLCVFWAIVGVLLYMYRKPKPNPDSPTENGPCPGTVDGEKPALLTGKTIYCSVQHEKAINLSVFVPEGVCHVFVALGLTQSNGSVLEGNAVSVERLRAVDRTPEAYVSVGYRVLVSKKDAFKDSLKDFMDRYPAPWSDRFQGIEVRGVPLADYQNDATMDTLNTAIADVKAGVTKVQKVIATLTLPIISGLPTTIAESAKLTNVDKVIAQTHYIPDPASCNVRPANSFALMEQAKNSMAAWKNKPCPSMLLGSLRYREADKENKPAGSCDVKTFCEADQASEIVHETLNKESALRKKSLRDWFIYDTPNKIRIKATAGRDMGCLYVDRIELDDAQCKCQNTRQFPLLTNVRTGME